MLLKEEQDFYSMKLMHYLVNAAILKMHAIATLIWRSVIYYSVLNNTKV